MTIVLASRTIIIDLLTIVPATNVAIMTIVFVYLMIESLPLALFLKLTMSKLEKLGTIVLHVYNHVMMQPRVLQSFVISAEITIVPVIITPWTVLIVNTKSAM